MKSAEKHRYVEAADRMNLAMATSGREYQQKQLIEATERVTVNIPDPSTGDATKWEEEVEGK